MSEANKALVRRHLKAINSKDLDGFAANYADDVAYHGAGGMEATGPEAITGFLNMFLAAFPDLTNIVDDIVAEGDMVAFRTTGGGTHTGDLQGIPPTGKSVTVSAINLSRERRQDRRAVGALRPDGNDAAAWGHSCARRVRLALGWQARQRAVLGA